MRNNPQNNRPFLIAVTGSIASGKSTVADMLKELGVVTIDSDSLAREVVELGSEGLKQVIDKFGADYMLPDGNLDRKKMAALIFSDTSAKKALEEILHPLIQKLFREKLEKLSKSKSVPNIAAYIVPLLFESKNTYPEIKSKVVIAADKEICIKRIITRDKCTPELAEKKYNSQMAIEEKIKLADFVIWNNQSEEELKKEVKCLHQALLAEIGALS